MLRLVKVALPAALLLAGCSQQPGKADRADVRQDPAPGTSTAAQAAQSAAPATVPPVRPLPPLAGRGPLAPRDQCSGQPGADAFRSVLEEAVANRDSKGLAALADREIKLDFGGGHGVAELRRQLDGAEGKALWRELEDVLRLGCAVDGGNLIIPWYFAQDLGDRDAFATMLVLGDNVPLRSRADPAASASAMLDWQWVELLDGLRVGPYQQVRTSQGKTGYVKTGDLRSVLDYRLVVHRSANGWKISAFVAGD